MTSNETPKLVPQSLITILSYATLTVLVFLPTLSYDIVSLKQRLYYCAYMIVVGTILAYTMNCMIIGSCKAWTWIVTVICVIIPAFIGVMYIIKTDTTKDIYNRFQIVLGEDSKETETTTETL